RRAPGAPPPGGRRRMLPGPWSPAGAFLIALVFLVAVGDRGVRALLETPRATANINEQQIQVALFLREHYTGSTIALNDIGAANFLADIVCVDLYGLASHEVLKALRQGTYGVKTLERITREKGARVAVLYPNWIRTPSSWTRVGHWSIADNVVNGGDTVAFFALDAEERSTLTRNLKLHSSKLPPGVDEGGLYAELP
ncbi:MAG: hypothetical protein V1774_01150, partial [Candidatus Eisenbacteria bacterium]